jgi:hypothetical protein
MIARITASQLVAFLLIGCASFHTTVEDGLSASAPIAVAISPTAATVTPGSVQQFVAIVSGAPDREIIWTVNGIPGGNDVAGAVSSSGVYSAPPRVSSAISVNVQAVSAIDHSARANAKVTVANVVSLSPTSATLAPGGTIQFTAILDGKPTVSVRWTVNGIAGGDSQIGTISFAGDYTAPASTPDRPVTVAATDAGDSSASASAIVSVYDPAVIAAHNQWIAGAAAAAASYGCTDSPVQQQPEETIAEVVARFGLTAPEGACIVLSPVSSAVGLFRYSLAWGGAVGAKDIVYISDVSRPRIWRGVEVTKDLWDASAQQPYGAQSAQTVALSPGDNIQSAVDSNPENTQFVLWPGIYRMQSVEPKNGDVFIGQAGAILNGSQVLSFRPAPQGSGLWTANASYDAWPYGNACLAGYPLCYAPQDLFIDGRIQLREVALEGLMPGKWYFDEATNQVYLPIDPTGHLVEIGMQTAAFSGNATGVLIQNLTIEKYESHAQFGAIQSGSSWTVDDVECRWNHGAGISLGPGSQILSSFVHHNGQIGIKFTGTDDVGELGTNMIAANNEISWNNYAGYDYQWEAGGSKFLFTSKLIVEGNYVHDNYGPGLWSDTDNWGAQYEANALFNNEREGIRDEANYETVIRNNVALGNGNNESIWSWSNATSWLWGAQIFLQDTSRAVVSSNTVEVPTKGGNGIAIVNQPRNSGPFGVHVATNNTVEDNTTTFLSPSGASGFAADPPEETDAGNVFNTNRYILKAGNATSTHWSWSELVDWAGFRATGQEANGTCCN